MATQQVTQREFELGHDDLRFIIELVAQKTGIVLAEHKEDMIYSRIARRLRHLGLRTFRQYCDLLQDPNQQDELVHFVNALTTNMTSFFRESHHFDHLREQVLIPRMSKPATNKRLRLWSSACSSGAEPYSMAVTCLELMEKYKGWDIKILATDIDTNMVAKAKNGIYSTDELSGMPVPLQHKYTQPADKSGYFQMDERARSMITFKQLNLLEAWPFRGPFDAVFCRNVVIYFNRETQRTLFNRMADYISAGNWLYLGHSESLHEINHAFTLKGKTIYQRCEGK